LLQAIGISRFTIHLNNRMVLTGLLQKLSLADQSTAVLRALDKLGKIGVDKVAEEMVATAGASPEQAREVLRLAELRGSNDEIVAELQRLVGGTDLGGEGVTRVSEILSGLQAAGLPPGRVKLDVAIARGLDYYTGAVYETFLDELPTIGSVCSGGRYDNLAELFTRQQLPGIGASLGLDRLLAAMESLGMVAKVRTPAPVFIPYFDPRRLGDYLRWAAALRAAGFGVEVYPEAKKLGQQLKYADARGHAVAVIGGETEFAAGSCQLKDLATGGSQTISLADGYSTLIDAIRRVLRRE
jgi:histidyl-tRNA synthetase